MTSALPPSIWWERPPSFGTSGAVPLPRGWRQAGQRQSVLGPEDGRCSRGTERIGLGQLGPPPPPPRGRTEGRTPSRGRLTLSDAGAMSPKA